MDDVARAAGVVRRTLYGYFTVRDELIMAVAAEAAAGLAALLERPVTAGADATYRLARLAFDVWSHGHDTRVLTALARQVDVDNVQRGLAPITAALTAVVAEGQRRGEFADHLPVATMVRVLEGQAIQLHRASADGTWSGDATSAAVAALITVGVDRHVAVQVVEALTGEHPR